MAFKSEKNLKFQKAILKVVSCDKQKEYLIKFHDTE